METEVVGKLRCEACGKLQPPKPSLNTPRGYREARWPGESDPEIIFTTAPYCTGCTGYFVDEAGQRWGRPGPDGKPVPPEEQEANQKRIDEALFDAFRAAGWEVR